MDPPFSKEVELFASENKDATVPGHHLVSLKDVDGLHNFLKEEMCTPTLDLMAPHLWIMTTQSCENVTPLHVNCVKGRAVVITEDPGLHLVWQYGRIFIKPLPKFLMSHDFWRSYITNDACREVRQAALGFLRTYKFMIRHESDLHIAQTCAFPLIPRDVTWEQWCRFVSTIKVSNSDVSPRYADYGELRLTRLNFYVKLILWKSHYAQVRHSQYATYFARLYGPLLFLFGLFSVALSAMQVEMSVEATVVSSPDNFQSGTKRPWHGFWWLSRWLSTVILALLAAVTVGLAWLFFYKLINEWIFALRVRYSRDTRRVRQRYGAIKS